MFAEIIQDLITKHIKEKTESTQFLQGSPETLPTSALVGNKVILIIYLFYNSTKHTQ